jgi:hypothetical protein
MSSAVEIGSCQNAIEEKRIQPAVAESAFTKPPARYKTCIALGCVHVLRCILTIFSPPSILAFISTHFFIIPESHFVTIIFVSCILTSVKYFPHRSGNRHAPASLRLSKENSLRYFIQINIHTRS